MRYVGRFAPSPTGPLHAGSIAVALASWLDARSQACGNGLWRLRMEDVDHTRCRHHWAQDMLQTLQTLGLHWDGPVIWQSLRHARYQQVLDGLIGADGWRDPPGAALSSVDSQLPLNIAYACSCSRQSPKPCRCVVRRRNDGDSIHPENQAVEQTLSWRINLMLREMLIKSHGMAQPVLRRADGCWSYTLAVVVDDADGGITHVVRGADLAEETPTQLALFNALGLSSPRYYRHVPLVLDEHGRKLSKSLQSPAALNADGLRRLSASLACLQQACQHLGLWRTAQARFATTAACLLSATQEWRAQAVHEE